MNKETQEQIQQLISEYGGLSRWWDVNAQLLAYASDEVIAAVDASTEANRQVRSANETWKNFESQYLHSPNPGLVDRSSQARKETEGALSVCQVKDDALIDQIRVEQWAERYLPRTRRERKVERKRNRELSKEGKGN
jgi:hypothetical protein